MKILFVYANRDDPCTIKSCFELSKGLKKYVESSTEVYYTKLNNELIEANDIIIFQRLGANGILISKLDEEKIFDIIRRFYNKKIFIYMIDDLLIEEQNGLPKRFLKECHSVICPNEPMKQQVNSYCKQCFILRTYVDIEAIDVIKKRDIEDFNIAWVSTGAIGRELIKSIIINIRKEFDIKFITMSGAANFLKGIEGVTNYKYTSFEDMISILKSTQILLSPYPINDIYFKTRIETRSKKTIKECLDCKSEIKYAIAGATRNVLISSKIAPYIYSIRNNENGLLVNNKVDEWVNAIKYIYLNKNIHQKLIIEANNDVLNRYSLDYAATKAIEIFNYIIDDFYTSHEVKIDI